MKLLLINGNITNDILYAKENDRSCHEIYHCDTTEEVNELLNNKEIDVVIIGFSNDFPDPQQVISLLNSQYPQQRVVFTIWDSKGEAHNFIKQGQLGPEFEELFSLMNREKQVNSRLHTA